MKYKKVFRRDEKKYILTTTEQEKLLRQILPHLVEDNYFSETICSLYFDTPNLDLIIKSIEKPLYKQKVRLRSYNVPQLYDTVFLESKIKYRGIVNKRRINIKLADFYNYFHNLEIGKPTELISNSPQIARELDYLFRFYHLRPAWFVAYDRESYVGKENSSLRITFDKNLRSRTENLRLEKGDTGEKYFKNNECVMEIKALDALPMWLASALSDLKIYPKSFTKYGKIYEKFKKEILC